MSSRLHLSSVVDIDFLILSMLPPILAPLLRTVCSSWASAIPHYGLLSGRDEYDYDPEDLALYLAEQGFFDSLKWLSCCAAPFGDIVPLLSKLVIAGGPEHLEWVLDVSNKFDRITKEEAVEVCSVIGRSGRLDLLGWCLSRDDFGRSSMVGVSERSCAATVNWALQHSVQCWLEAYTVAAGCNDIDLLDSLYAHKAHFFARGFPRGCHISRPEHAAAKNGNIDVLQWLRSAPGYTTNYCSATAAAARAGRMDVLCWLAQNDLLFTLTTLPCEEAARCGSEEIVRWLHFDKGCPWDEFVTLAAVEGGHLALFQWLCSQECPYNLGAAMRRAVKHGHINFMEWAAANGTPCDPCAFTSAAQDGQLEALRWYRARGGCWDECICQGVASVGQSAALGWLVSGEGGARGLLTKRCLKTASRGGYLGTIRILVAAGCPMSAKAIAFASRNGCLSIIRFLYDKGCPMSDLAFSWISRSTRINKTLAILEWLWSHGCPWTARACDSLVKHTKPEICAWAIQKGYPPTTVAP